MNTENKETIMIEDTTEQKKILALANFLELLPEDYGDIEVSRHDDQIFEYGRQEYLVLTDSEADEKVGEYIKQSLWAFNASFLASETDLPEEVFTAIQSNDKHESNNDVMERLIERSDGGMEGFIESAISADGRGQFLAQYDNEENEEGGFYIYRTN